MNRDERSAGMLAWLDEHGVDRSRVEVVRRPDGERELVARGRIRKGDVILRVPPRCHVTTQVADDSEVGRRIARRSTKFRRHARLAAFLALEKRNPRSVWRRYLDALPLDLRHLPPHFGAREEALLAGSPTAARIKAFRASIDHDHETLRRECRLLRDLGRDEFVWSFLMATTRSFAQDEGQALVPLADMMNHVSDPETTGGFDTASGDYVIVALTDCEDGQTLRGNYGPRCNSRLLLGYGFCLEENPFNSAVLAFDDPRGGRRRFTVTATRADADTLFSYLRRACATPSELELLAERRVGRGPVSPIGSRNERAALQALASVVRATLAGYETTIEQDDELLADPSRPRTERACLLLRRGEKRVLQAYLDLALATLPFLRLGAADFKRIATRHAAAATFSGGHLATLAWRAPVGRLDLFAMDDD